MFTAFQSVQAAHSVDSSASSLIMSALAMQGDDWRSYVTQLFTVAFPDEAGRLDAEAIEWVLANPKDGRTWNVMPDALNRLAGYFNGDTYGFVRAVGTLFGGLPSPSETGIQEAVLAEVWGERHEQWAGVAWGTVGEEWRGPPGGDGDANVHHWAWSFVLGYTVGTRHAKRLNSQLEIIQAGQRGRPVATEDLKMGSLGARIGGDLMMRQISIQDVGSRLKLGLGLP
jgi:hypothetical protein